MNMFNIEKEILTMIANAILNQYPNCHITNSFVYAPPKFPCAAIVFTDDGMTGGMRDSSHDDNFRDITITADTFSNKVNGKQSEAESIMQIIIDTLTPYNFTMVSCKPNGNLSNAQNYRITALFIATVDKDGNIYQRR